LREHGDPLPLSVLRDLVALVPCDRAGFVAYNAHSHTGHGEQALFVHDDQGVAASPAEIAAIYWANFWTWAASNPERTGDYATIIRDSDFSVSRC
jgi:hypothetical protein